MAKLETLQDDFNDSSLDLTKWTATNYTNWVETTTLNALIDSSVLSTSLNSIDSFDVTDSYCTLKIEHTGVINNDNTFKFGVYDSVNEAYVYLGFYNDAGTNALTLNAFFFGGDFYINPVASYDSAVHKYFKIRFSVDTFYLDLSTDGVAYTNAMSVTPDPFFTIDKTNIKARFQIDQFSSDDVTFFISNLNKSATPSNPCVKLRGKCKLRGKIKLR